MRDPTRAQLLDRYAVNRKPEPERRGDPRYEARPRRYLVCGQMFQSEHAGNRICGSHNIREGDIGLSA